MSTAGRDTTWTASSDGSTCQRSRSRDVFSRSHGTVATSPATRALITA